MTEALTAAATALADTLAQENAALAALDLGAAASLLEQKRAAAAAFARAQADSGLPDTTQRPLAARLRDLAEENRVLLERGLRVQTRVLELVARAVQRPAAARYGARGAPACGAIAPVIVSARV